MKASEALRFAFNRALAVMWGGLVAAVLYLSIVLLGPGLEGRFFPVMTDYRVTEFSVHPEDGSITFRPRFTKVRDCVNYGSSWFAVDAEGNYTRVQLNSAAATPVPIATGPLGRRVGNPQQLAPPKGAVAFLGTLEHDCGLVWHTRTQVGPFSVTDGKPVALPAGNGRPF